MEQNILNISYHPFELLFRYPFRIAHGERTFTPVVFVEIAHNGLLGYGEAALPPYLAETTKTVGSFLESSKPLLKKLNDNFSLEELELFLINLNEAFPGNKSAKAALEMALLDLWGKKNNLSLKKIFNPHSLPDVFSTFTIGICGPEEMKLKISGANEFSIFKIKLNGISDKKNIELFLNISERMKSNRKVSFCVDVNQGWKDKFLAMDMVHWLSEKGAFLIEQPLPVKMLDESAYLTERSPIPVIADESVQGLEDIEKVKGAFSGINIKLMKTGGLYIAKKMISRARELEMKILIGCMSESSCGVTAAAHLSPLADWADLDGPYLIKNDPFEGVKIKDGKIWLPDEPGMGVKKN